jgi:hypothetical protein
MNRNPDRLYELMPLVHRMRDAEQGYPLKALLAVIAEQVNVVEHDIAQLYDNWFIETCEDWVAPYIGDLIGYRPVGESHTEGARALGKVLYPRREIANTVAARRRKGTLALLELLASDVAGWPARAVEFYRLLGWTQHLNHLRPNRGGTVNLRSGRALDLIGGPFDGQAHGVDVRRINSTRESGRHNITNIGVFAWRLKTYPLTDVVATCMEDEGMNCFSFNVLGSDTQLYNRPLPETSPTSIAAEVNLPVPVRRRALATAEAPVHASDDYYGAMRSMVIAVMSPRDAGKKEVEAISIVPADLSSWHCKIGPGQVALDPQLGRIMFPKRKVPKDVWVSYRYAFSADMGGGEYPRPLTQPEGAQVYAVGLGQTYASIGAALAAWQTARDGDSTARAAVIEIRDSGVYTEPLTLELIEGESLEIRAGLRLVRPAGDTTGWTRPVIRLLDYQSGRPDSLNVRGKAGSRLVLEGLLVMGRGVLVNGGPDYGGEGGENPPRTPGDELCDLTIRHCTLVPGWGIDCHCEPLQPNEPSLVINDSHGTVVIDHSIVGTIRVRATEVTGDPVRIVIRDSIVDATGTALAAIESDEESMAFATLSISRSTILGTTAAHAVALAENSIFTGALRLARRQHGCVRFCYVAPGSRTPRRYHCEPDLRRDAVNEAMPGATADERDAALLREQGRVRPLFTSTRYGNPAYCQLAPDCADEIKQGADDESEMGAFHDLFQPQREANLRTRLNEYTPASMDVGIIFAN